MRSGSGARSASGGEDGQAGIGEEVPRCRVSLDRSKETAWFPHRSCGQRECGIRVFGAGTKLGDEVIELIHDRIELLEVHFKSMGNLLDIGEVASRSGMAASKLLYYEREEMIASADRSGLRRQY